MCDERTDHTGRAGHFFPIIIIIITKLLYSICILLNLMIRLCPLIYAYAETHR